MSIDWSKAPEWANELALNPYGEKALLGNDGYSYLMGNGGVVPWTFETAYDRSAFKIMQIRPRPPAWTGEGLPPVGLEVEGRVAVGHYVGAEKSEWATCALVCSSRAYVVLRCIGPGYSEDHEVSHELALVEFRPVRTAEQIAAEEREEEIKLMLGLIKQWRFSMEKTPENPKQEARAAAEALHAAGYRKQVSE